MFAIRRRWPTGRKTRPQSSAGAGGHGTCYRRDADEGNKGSLHRETTASVRGIQSSRLGGLIASLRGRAECSREHGKSCFAFPFGVVSGLERHFLAAPRRHRVSRRRQATDIEGTMPSSLVTVTH